MMFCRVACVFLAAGMFAFSAYAQDYPFTDNFSNPAQTSLKWGKWYASDALQSAVCSGGVYTITNQHTDATPGLIYHYFANKTSTYTASCVVTRGSTAIAAGMWLCLSPFPTFSGYAVQLNSGTDCVGYLTVTKYVSGSPTHMFEAEYHLQTLSDTIMVSEQGSAFTVFCNGVFLGRFTDNSPSAPGDFALLVPPNSTAAFDNVSFTDQFTSGSFPSAFIDNFNNGTIEKQWIFRRCSNITEHDTVLDIRAPGSSDTGTFIEIPMAIDTFYSRLIVSHRSGDSNAFYGFYLRGPDAGNTYPSALFGISGLRACGAYMSTGGTVKYAPPGYIYGKGFVNGPGDTTFFQDTIVVTKTGGSNNYLMYINGHCLDTLTTTEINFSITGAGIFSGGGQNIFVDYFFVGPDLSASPVVNRYVTLRGAPRGIAFSPLTSRYLFDPLGRKVGMRDAAGRMNVKALAPGYFITNEGKNGIIIKK
jgi:hypothetical protein